MPELVLGPLLRHVGSTDATVWVETDQRCEVDVLGRTAATFEVEGHHFAIVAIRGLHPGTHAYQVALNGRVVWPDPGSDLPPSLIRTLDADEIDLAFGSCRVTAPHEAAAAGPGNDQHQGCGIDALRALAMRMVHTAPAAWPDCLLLLGDQVYADEVSPQTARSIAAQRDTSAPHADEVANFEEYTHLYREAWQEPTVRWMLSNVGTTMLWDDHDVHDDWNISQAWLEHARAQPWWAQRITGALMSYWLYQHIGNLSPAELEADALLAAVRGADDGGATLRAFANEVANDGVGPRWSIRRDFGRIRLVGLDCRAGRVLTPGARSMLSEADWRWFEQQADGDFDHLLVAVSTPYLLTPALHHLESWSEAVCDGAWGRAMAALGERVRQAIDLDHWAAFRHSFERLTDMLCRAGEGQGTGRPASIVVLSGDIHSGSVSELVFPIASAARAPTYQIVSSPLRNSLGRWERRALKIAGSTPAAWFGRALLATVGLKPPRVRWHNLAGPWFDNHISTIQVRARQISVRVERAVHAEPGRADLALVTAQRLA